MFLDPAMSKLVARRLARAKVRRARRRPLLRERLTCMRTRTHEFLELLFLIFKLMTQTKPELKFRACPLRTSVVHCLARLFT